MSMQCNSGEVRQRVDHKLMKDLWFGCSGTCVALTSVTKKSLEMLAEMAVKRGAYRRFYEQFGNVRR